MRRLGRHRGLPRRRSLLLAALVAVTLLDSATLAGAAVLHARRLERVAGVNAVSAPEVDAAERTGAFETDIEYAALFSGEGHRVESRVSWNDDWFFEDASAYNAELAHTCAVLSAVANAESAYYQQGSTSPAYAEHAFAALGFDEVCTASYRYRSEILDEVIGVVDGTDVVAYTLATKRIVSSRTGAEKELVVVVVRGSYGSEWLSNIKIEGATGAAGAGEDEDHLGFTIAASEIVTDLEARASDLEPGVERSYLFCGHSRGGAVANLLASYADDVADGSRALATAGDVRAYTFAAPNCTSSPEARSCAYDNIFNVINPSDLVPQLPLEAWGYARYGRDVSLPEQGDAGFAELLDAMRASYAETMGTECAADPADREVVESFVRGIAQRASSFSELVSPAGIVQLAAACAQIDLGRLLASHYPNTYIAWLEAAARSGVHLA